MRKHRMGGWDMERREKHYSGEKNETAVCWEKKEREATKEE